MYDMQSEKTSFPLIFNHSSIECKDEIEEKFERSRNVVFKIVGNVSEREAHDALQTAVCRDQKTHDEVCLGLLASVMTDPSSANKCFRDLTFLSREFQVVLDCLVQIALDKYPKLTDQSRVQFVWILKEMIKASMNGADVLCWNVLRQIAGGDVTNRNLWLAEYILEIFIENRAWLDKYPVVIAAAIFTYLRILEDHTAPSLASLKQKEIKFVVSLIRDHFTDCCINPNIGMGRDFLRLLQCVSKIPEISAIWMDIFENPKSLSPHLTGVHQILNVRTSRKYLILRLTPDMEKKINFLTSQVKFGIHKRYQDWFQRQYLATAESQSLRADLIRFIVGVIHPPNEVLCSDILPRWAVIGWLLTTCTQPAATANAKLALFYDWLVFDPYKDNIMNIEPGILVMYHSLKAHLTITATLLDFLIRMIQEYWPKGVEKIKNGVGAALQTIVDKKVLPSLEPLLENPKLDPDLRTAVQENLIVLLDRPRIENNNGDLLNSINMLMNDNGISLPSTNNGNSITSNNIESSHKTSNCTLPNKDTSSSSIDMTTYSSTPAVNSVTYNASNVTPCVTRVATGDAKPSLMSPVIPSSNIYLSDPPQLKIPNPPEPVTLLKIEPQFSDEDESENEEEISNVQQKNFLIGDIPKRNSPSIGASAEEAEKSKIFELVQILGTNLRLPIEEMLKDFNSEDLSEYLDEIIEELSSQIHEKEEREVVSKALLHVYKSDLEKPCLDPESCTNISPDIEISPIKEIMSFLLKSRRSDKNPKCKSLYRVLIDMTNQSPSVGYKILVLLSSMIENEENYDEVEENYIRLYNAYASFRSMTVLSCLKADLHCCWEYEPAVVGTLVPIIFDWFRDESIGCSDILRLIVSAIDSSQLQDIVWRVAQSDILLLDEYCLVPLINKSLDWETWEQHCLWTIARSHHFSVDEYLPVIPNLDYKNHSEALTVMLLMLRSEKPSEKILSTCFCRKPAKEDRFLISLLSCWCESNEVGVADALAALLVKASGSPVKRKRGGTTGGRGTSSPAGPLTPSVESVLGHLDLYRDQVSNEGVFKQDSMLAALLQVQSWVTETQKMKYKDLLSLAASEETSNSKEMRSCTKRAASIRKIPTSPTSSRDINSAVNKSNSSSISSVNSSNVSRTRSGRTRKVQNLKLDSEESSEEDDEAIKKPKAKKRRKITVDDDSD